MTLKSLKAKTRVIATEGEGGGDSEADIKKQIDALDGKEGGDIADKRRALYDKLEKLKGKGEEASTKVTAKEDPNKASPKRKLKEDLHELNEKLDKLVGNKSESAYNQRQRLKKQIRDIQGKLRVMDKKASTAKTLAPIDVKAAVQSMAKMEVADAEPSMPVTKLIDILKQRFNVVGVVKVFEASSFLGKGMTLLTRQSGGDIFAMKMVLGGNGFVLVARSKVDMFTKSMTFARVATNDAGTLVNVEVTLLSGVPDLASICIKPA